MMNRWWRESGVIGHGGLLRVFPSFTPKNKTHAGSILTALFGVGGDTPAGGLNWYRWLSGVATVIFTGVCERLPLFFYSFFLPPCPGICVNRGDPPGCSVSDKMTSPDCVCPLKRGVVHGQWAMYGYKITVSCRSKTAPLPLPMGWWMVLHSGVATVWTGPDTRRKNTQKTLPRRLK